MANITRNRMQFGTLSHVTRSSQRARLDAMGRAFDRIVDFFFKFRFSSFFRFHHLLFGRFRGSVLLQSFGRFCPYAYTKIDSEACPPTVQLQKEQKDVYYF